MAGSWSNSYQVSLTLPTGATIGARIVLDGDSGTILVYDETNQLIASIAPEDTNDPAGNTVLQGITNYSGSEYIQLGFGNVLLGVLPDPLDPTFDPQPGELSIIGDSSEIALQSATNQDLPDPSFLEIRGGVRGSGTGDALNPHSEFTGDVWVSTDTTGFNSAAAYALLSSYTPAGQGTSIPEVWHTPPFNTNWLTSTTFNGTTNWGGVQYRMDPFDNIEVIGCFKAAATLPGSAVWQFPVGWRPKKQWPLWVQKNAGGTITQGFAGVSTSGNVNLLSGISPTAAASAEYMISGTFPRGNLQ